MAVTIRDLKVFITSPDSTNIVVVKVETSEPGLYGLGCATFTQRCLAVKTVLEEYIRPLLIGRNVANIEDIWQTLYSQSYWRNGPVLNNALSGVDQALWDIKGKMANMPVFDLLGGKCREAAMVYGTIGGRTLDDFDKNFQKMLDRGYRILKCVRGGSNAPSTPELDALKPEGAPTGNYFNPRDVIENFVEIIAHCREKFGYDVGLIVDVHEKLRPIEAIELAKRLEPYRMFYIEDSLMPEHQEWFEQIRAHSTAPLANGELYNNINEIRPVIANRHIDYLRCHVSQIGGLSPARKLATLCEMFGVRTAWHGPGDLAPVGLVAQLHLDLASPAFGIQEYAELSDLRREMFPGCPEMRNGYLYANDKPGFGIDFNEELAGKYPPVPFNPNTWQGRLPDGTAVRC